MTKISVPSAEGIIHTNAAMSQPAAIPFTNISVGVFDMSS